MNQIDPLKEQVIDVKVEKVTESANSTSIEKDKEMVMNIYFYSFPDSMHPEIEKMEAELVLACSQIYMKYR